jgi:hypothetical protein
MKRETVDILVRNVDPRTGSDSAAMLRRRGAELIAPSIGVAEIVNAICKKCLRREIEPGDTAPALRSAISQLTGIVRLSR